MTWGSAKKYRHPDRRRFGMKYPGFSWFWKSKPGPFALLIIGGVLLWLIQIA